MKKQLILFAFSLFSVMLNAQSVPKAFEDWKTALGTQNFFYKNVTKTSGSYVYVAGSTINGNGDMDILLAKYDTKGVVQWVQQYAGTGNSADFATDIVIDGSYVYLTGAVTNNTVTPETDLILMKYSTAGVLQWASTYNNPSGNLHDAGKMIYLDPSTGYICITGSTYNSSMNADMLTIAYNSSGTAIWSDIYDYAGYDDAGIKIGLSGPYIIVTGAVANTASTASYKVGSRSYNRSTGAIINTTTQATVYSNNFSNVCDVATDASGNFYIAGSEIDPLGGTNFSVQKIAVGGLQVVWTYTWSSSGYNDDQINAVQIDNASNIYIAGSSTSASLGKEITMIKLNSSGVNQWTQTSGFAGDDEITDMVIDASVPSIYVTGYRKNATNGDNNYYTAKYNSGGTKIWEVESDGMSLSDKATNIALNGTDIVVTGQSETAPNVRRFLTTKYVQMDVKNPVDLYGQPTNPSFGYHANLGQILDETGAPAPNALYYTHHQNPEIYIEKNSYNYVFAVIDTVMSTNDSLEKIHVSFNGSSATARPYAYDSKTYPLNYFLGHLTEPVTNVVGNDRMVTKNLYSSIDLHYFSNANGLKYYFVVNPGGKQNEISMNIAGANSTNITSNNLVIDGVMGDITLKQPYAYMVNNAGVTTTLTGTSNWVSTGSNTYSISVPSYTTSQTLIIVVETVPVVASASGITANLDYSSYYGGNTVDKFSDVKTSATGGRVVTGYSYGGTFPTVLAFQANPASSGGVDGIILKYSAGDTLKWATYIGGNGADFGNSIALYSNGDVIIGGETQSTDIVGTNNSGQTNQTANGFNTTNNLKSDGFLFKLREDGQVKLFYRYVGGNKADKINAIYVDASDNLYFGGTSSSPNFPCVSANRGSMNASTNTDPWDCVLGKFNSGLTAQWITYFGGTVNGNSSTSTLDFITDILTDNSGNVFISGYSDETNFPATNPSPGNANVLFDNSNNGGTDGFIARFTSGGVPNYATLIGGNAGDYVYRLAYNSNTQNLHFAGTVGSASGFPYKTKSGAYNSSVLRGSSVAFLGYINSSLEHQWITNYGRGGSAKYTGCAGLSVDNTGVVYLSGGTNSDTLVYGSTVPVGSYTDNSLTGGSDGYVAIFDNNKQIKHAFYFGGSATEQINNSDLYADSRLYVVGNTASSNMPIAYTPATAALIDSTFNGSDDAFISRFVLYSYNGVGVKETIKNSENSVLLFPNPANNFVTLKVLSELEGNASLKVYNTIGQIIYEETINTNEKTIDCNSWARGMYIFVVSNKTINSSFKIIKE